MPHPSEVNPSKFNVEQIIYNIDGFSIAYGIWVEDNKKYLAVRWDGEENTTGFPQSFGRPQWLIIPDDLTVPFAKALLDTDEQTDKNRIIEILRTLI